MSSLFFFFNDTATTEIYTLSLHDALPICEAYGPVIGFLFGWACLLVILTGSVAAVAVGFAEYFSYFFPALGTDRDRKSTRLNSSHANISYAVFCLKKKKKHKYPTSIILST